MTKKKEKYSKRYMEVGEYDYPTEDIAYGLFCLKYGEWVQFVCAMGLCERLEMYSRGDDCMDCFWSAINVKFNGRPLTNMPVPRYLAIEGSENRDIKFCKHESTFVRCRDYLGEKEDIWLKMPWGNDCRCKKPVSKNDGTGDF